jgi:hypothetical protein
MNMAERSAPAVHWVLVTLMLWILARVLPTTGARRNTPAAAFRKPLPGKGVGGPVRLPAPRVSPYSTDHAPLDGAASRLVRPYVTTARETAARQLRRTILVLAADFGIDLDTRDIHTAPAAVWGGMR